MTVTVGLVAIMATLIAPSAARVLRQYRLATVSSQVGLELSRTRSLAVAKGRQTRLRFSGAHSYWVEYQDPSTGEWVQETEGGERNLPQDMNVTVAGTGITAMTSSGAVRFYPSGLADGSYYIVLSSGEFQRIVRVNIMGSVEVVASAEVQ